MEFKFTNKEMSILKKALADFIEIGLSAPQEAYLLNIDKGMDPKDADKIYKKENIQHWKYMVAEKKDPAYILYDKLFKSPASKDF